MKKHKYTLPVYFAVFQSSFSLFSAKCHSVVILKKSLYRKNLFEEKMSVVWVKKNISCILRFYGLFYDLTLKKREIEKCYSLFWNHQKYLVGHKQPKTVLETISVRFSKRMFRWPTYCNEGTSFFKKNIYFYNLEIYLFLMIAFESSLPRALR